MKHGIGALVILAATALAALAGCGAGDRPPDAGAPRPDADVPLDATPPPDAPPPDDDAGPARCADDRDCPPSAHCDVARELCEDGCSSDEGCAATPGTPRCDVRAHACVGCVVRAHCPATEHCDAASQACVAGCSADEGCEDTGAAHCDASLHVCVACVHDGQCGAGEVCTSNRCRAGCVDASSCLGAGELCCAERCVDRATDAANCGGCGIVCAEGEVCDGGACATPCPPGQLRCGGACVAPSADPLHCGGCGLACPGGTSCASGMCVAECPAGQTSCASSCVSLATDVAHCGACGVTCAPGEACDAGVCTCRSGTTRCDGACVDLDEDPAACGFCGNVCAPGEACVAGGCTPICPAGTTPCEGACRDLARDEDHCGACGVVCSAGCVSGACATVEDVEANGTNTCVRYASGRVFCWGNNAGMLTGRAGTAGHSASPLEVVDAISRPLENVRQMALGARRACAVHTDGIVYCWGNGLALTQVPDLALVTQISGFDTTFCARRFDGTVHCFGDDLVATPRDDVGDAAEVAVGRAHLCVRTRAGLVRCAGDDAYGQLGDGASAASSTAFVEVSGLVDAASLSAGADHTCARRASREVVCWGRNQHGQLGDGTFVDAPAPVSVPGLTVRQVRAGGAHTCALTTDGTIACWGEGTQAALGDGVLADRASPAAVPGLSAQRWVTAGDHHACALSDTLEVRCWGDNTFGEAGGDTERQSAPAAVLGLSGVVALDQGGTADSNAFRCALLDTGEVHCWGGLTSNASGQLGNGTTTPSVVPVRVSGLSDARAIAVGGTHACALRTGGTVVCWGGDSVGQLGDGAPLAAASSPVPVTGLSGVQALAASNSTTCALLAGGTVRCWGYNFYGALGAGIAETQNSSVPVDVVGLSTVTAITGGSEAMCALRADGAVWCWGRNTLGELADGTLTNRTVPGAATTEASTATLPVPLTGVTSVVCSFHSCLAAQSSSSVPRLWGDRAVRAAPNGAFDGVVDWRLHETSSNISRCVTADRDTWRCNAVNEWGAAGAGATSPARVSAPVVGRFTRLDLAPVPMIGPNCAVGADARAYCWGQRGAGRLAAVGLDALTRTPAVVVVP